eukprot:14033861-Heterocapsa_arctica.AAC.1
MASTSASSWPPPGRAGAETGRWMPRVPLQWEKPGQPQNCLCVVLLVFSIMYELHFGQFGARAACPLLSGGFARCSARDSSSSRPMSSSSA